MEKLVSGHCPHDETPDLVAGAIGGWWPRAVERAREGKELTKTADLVAGGRAVTQAVVARVRNNFVRNG